MADVTVDDIAARRIAADRAEVAALHLHRLARDLDCPADVRESERGRGILQASRGEAAGALARLAYALPNVSLSHRTTALAQAGVVRPARDARDVCEIEAHEPLTWSAAWERFALEVDP